MISIMIYYDSFWGRLLSNMIRPPVVGVFSPQTRLKTPPPPPSPACLGAFFHTPPP
ncbi:hypothetical protein HanHA300_Chr03g0109371 [Helianthus annuus]|nr:hypothetical protein HanHA300_Chr03g0109371 [Helianthus annuus]KAJ0609552.1 hypothetical protein HanHA89_Chr03g0121251 [Helianthus annuus]KAJ0769600.1 hypothetical protein HanLR1_Chr03g0114561 [Helianthus annuus]KAJ0775332.1 hypothetical protein HanOQP8_Chr03g0121771 [Helianthus annuus]